MTTATIGAAKISRIEESYGPFFEAKAFFTDWRDEIVAEHMPWMVPDHFDPASGYLKLSIHSWLIEIGGRTILIDTCVGNHKPRAARPFWDQLNTPYLDRLAAAGVRPEQIDYVMCTHLHVDHVGWNTRLENGRWVPTFPKARYVFGKTEFDYWTEMHAKTPVPPFGDSVLPIVEAKQAEIAWDDHRIGDHARILPTPGHTPGHVAFCFGRGRDDAVVSGDLMHSPLQTRYPELSA